MRSAPDLRCRVEAVAPHIHSLGPRPLAELVLALVRRFANEPGQEAEALDVIEAYRRLTPDMIRSARADRFPARLVPVPDRHVA